MDAARYTLPVRTRGLQAERRGSALGVAARVLPPHWNLTERWRARSPVATHRTQRTMPVAMKWLGAVAMDGFCIAEIVSS
jgi:hypothetical protein